MIHIFLEQPPTKEITKTDLIGLVTRDVGKIYWEPAWITQLP